MTTPDAERRTDREQTAGAVSVEAQAASTQRTAPADQLWTFAFVNLMVTNLLLRVCTYMLIVLIPLYALDRGLSPAEAGLTTTLYMLAAALIRPTAGNLVDVRGRFAVMIGGASLFCAATGLFVLSLPVWILLAARSIQGLGFAFNGTAVMTMATDIIPERHMAKGIGVLGLEQTVAQLFAPWMALELKSAYGYRTAFAVVFAISIANLLVRVPLGVGTRRLDAARKASVEHAASGPAARAPVTRWWHRIVERNASRAALVMFFVVFGTTGINTFMAAYAIEQGIGNAGLFFTGAAVTLAVSRLSVGALQRRVGSTTMISVGLVLVAASLMIVWWSPNLAALMLAGACYGLGIGVVQPGLMAQAVLSADPASRGLANSTFFMAMDLAQAVGAVALGGLANVFGLATVFTAGAVAVIAALAVFWAVRTDGLASATDERPLPA